MSDDEIDRIFAIHERVRFRKEAGTTERDIWIAAARRLFTPGERQPCWVCGKFRGITEAHHAVPLAMQYDRGFEYPDCEHVWLCPNHHAIAHAFVLDDNRSFARPNLRARDRRRSPIYEDLSDSDFDKVMKLIRMSARGPTE